MKDSLRNYVGTALVGATLADVALGTLHAHAKPDQKAHFGEIIPGSSFHPELVTLQALLRKDPNLVTGSYFLGIPSEAPSYTTRTAAEDAFVAYQQEGSLMLGVESGGRILAYDVYVFEGLSPEGLPVLRYIRHERDSGTPNGDCLTPTRVSGYYEYEGIRYFVTDIDYNRLMNDTTESKKIIPCSAVQPYTAQISESVNTTISNPEPLHPGPGGFINVPEEKLLKARFLYPIDNGRKKDTLEAMELVEHELDKGRVKLKFPKGSKYEGQCVVALTYQAVSEAEGYPTFILYNDDIQGHRVPCEVTPTPPPVAEDVKEPKEPKEPKPWDLGELSAGMGLGWNREELLGSAAYSLGDYGAVDLSLGWTPRPQLPATLLFDAGFIVPFSEDERGGLESLQLGVGYPIHAGPVELMPGLTGGMAFEPNAPETPLNGSSRFGILLDASYPLPLPVEGLNARCALAMNHDNYGQQGISDFLAYGWSPTAVCGVAYHVELRGNGELATKEKTTYEPQVHVETETRSYDGTELPVKKYVNEDATLKAEHIRLSEEMKRAAQANLWKNVERLYKSLEEMKVELTYDEYMRGAYAARALGNMQDCYVRLRYARQLQDSQEVRDWIAEIEANYAHVVLEVEMGYDGALALSIPEAFFDPAKRTALEAAQGEIPSQRAYNEFLPALNDSGAPVTYTIDGQTFVLTPLGPSSGERTTNVLRLEEK